MKKMIDPNVKPVIGETENPSTIREATPTTFREPSSRPPADYEPGPDAALPKARLGDLDFPESAPTDPAPAGPVPDKQVDPTPRAELAVGQGYKIKYGDYENQVNAGRCGMCLHCGVFTALVTDVHQQDRQKCTHCNEVAVVGSKRAIDLRGLEITR